MADSPIITSFVDSHTHSHTTPKLEDFFSDSSLTHIYNHSSAYFHEQQHDLKAIAGFPSFPTNSGSEVDDSASIGRISSQAEGRQVGVGKVSDVSLSMEDRFG